MNDKKTERRGLGRGLSALMADVSMDDRPGNATAGRTETRVPVENLSPNPDQPRRDYSQSALEELAASIREKGIIQPLIVRPRPDADGTFEIVAGERRWRAAQIAQLHELPVLIRDFTDTEVLEIAIIENIQRADLNPIEEASAYRQLMDRFGHTQEKLAESLGKSRSHIANLIRLLTLPEDVQMHLRAGALTYGHARALITSENASDLARQVVARGLSVRETEALARKPAAQNPAKRQNHPREKDADTRALEGDLSANLGVGVSIEHEAGGTRGRVVLRYSSLEQLDMLCRVLSAASMDVQ